MHYTVHCVPCKNNLRKWVTCPTAGHIIVLYHSWWACWCFMLCFCISFRNLVLLVSHQNSSLFPSQVSKEFQSTAESRRVTPTCLKPQQISWIFWSLKEKLWTLPDNFEPCIHIAAQGCVEVREKQMQVTRFSWFLSWLSDCCSKAALASSARRRSLSRRSASSWATLRSFSSSRARLVCSSSSGG